MRTYDINRAKFVVTIEEQIHREEIELSIKLNDQKYFVEGEIAYNNLNLHSSNKGYYFDITKLKENSHINEKDLSRIQYALNEIYSGESLEYFVDWK